jgi:hypothetical protein
VGATQPKSDLPEVIEDSVYSNLDTTGGTSAEMPQLDSKSRTLLDAPN